MLFLVPVVTSVLAVYVLAAVLPGVFLLHYIYRHDTVEKEPAGLLVQLLMQGVLSAWCASVLERLAQGVLSDLVEPGSPVYTILFAFLVVALAEEGMKFFFLKRRTWTEPNFNYRFDGVVYAVFVSLGFAIYENILYVFSYGLTTALVRAISAVPAHLSFAVVMGVFYGRARLMENRGEYGAAKLSHTLGLLSAIVLHGFYDACAMIGTTISVLAFVVFVVLMFIGVYGLVKRESATDAPV